MKLAHLIPAIFCVALPFAAGQEEEETEPTWPATTPGTFDIPGFEFDSGETLDLKIQYHTLGELKVNADNSSNAVLVLHGSGGEIGQFLNDDFAGTLFNPDQALDAEKYFIVIRDGIGHGNSSAPRNSELKGDFPSYQYSDMVRADHLLMTEHLGIEHARLIMGVSMGGMHTWQVART